MLSHRTQIRTRYGETDQMGRIYYSNYLTYFELGRVEWLRHLGLTYRRLEEECGVFLPVVEARVLYRRAATYDELLTLETKVLDKPQVRIRFDYRLLNPEEELLVEGWTVLAFVDRQTLRPCRPPNVFQELINPYWQP